MQRWVHARADYLRGNRLRQAQLVVALVALAVVLAAWVSQSETLFWTALALMAVNLGVDGIKGLRHARGDRRSPTR